MSQQELLMKILSDNGTVCTSEQVCQLVRFYELLTEKNKVMNLTAITEFEDVAIKHFADSLSLSRVVKLTDQKLLDVGTGAGFPGIPLKIIYPDLDITLMDSLNKRLVFLDEVIVELGLKGIVTLHARAEEAGRNSHYRGQFDLVVSRAVANLSTLVEYCIPFTTLGGSFVSYKSTKTQEEIAHADFAISVLGGKVKKVDTFTLSGTDHERSLICIDKVSVTPDKYPRGGGKPLNNPLVKK